MSEWQPIDTFNPDDWGEYDKLWTKWSSGIETVIDADGLRYVTHGHITHWAVCPPPSMPAPDPFTEPPQRWPMHMLPDGGHPPIWAFNDSGHLLKSHGSDGAWVYSKRKWDTRHCWSSWCPVPESDADLAHLIPPSDALRAEGATDAE
jgi:hypothetical protein